MAHGTHPPGRTSCLHSTGSLGSSHALQTHPQSWAHQHPLTLSCPRLRAVSLAESQEVGLGQARLSQNCKKPKKKQSKTPQTARRRFLQTESAAFLRVSEGTMTSNRCCTACPSCRIQTHTSAWSLSPVPSSPSWAPAPLRQLLILGQLTRLVTAGQVHGSPHLEYSSPIGYQKHPRKPSLLYLVKPFQVPLHKPLVAAVSHLCPQHLI